MEHEELLFVVPQALSSDCGSGWFHQDDGGGDDDDDEKPGLMRCQ